MFIISKRNIIFRDGDAKIFVQKDFMGNVPEWVCKTPLFKAMVHDGLIIVSESTKDAAVTKAVEKAEKVEKAAKKAKK